METMIEYLAFQFGVSVVIVYLLTSFTGGVK